MDRYLLIHPTKMIHKATAADRAVCGAKTPRLDVGDDVQAHPGYPEAYVRYGFTECAACFGKKPVNGG